jgi:hypothetical protein
MEPLLNSTFLYTSRFSSENRLVLPPIAVPMGGKRRRFAAEKMPCREMREFKRGSL